MATEVDSLAALDDVRLELDGSFIQTADINMADTETWNGGAGFDPIKVFTGSYDGDGYVCSNLHISRSGTTDVGLFGATLGSVLERIGLEDVSVVGGQSVGALVGECVGTVTECYSTGAVSGGISKIGGLLGYHETSGITDCYSHASAAGGDDVGGLVGHVYQAPVTTCYSIGAVSGGATVGGLVGRISTGGAFADNDNLWDTETSGAATSAMGTGKTTSEMQAFNTWDAYDIRRENELIEWEPLEPRLITGTSL